MIEIPTSADVLYPTGQYSLDGKEIMLPIRVEIGVSWGDQIPGKQGLYFPESIHYTLAYDHNLFVSLFVEDSDEEQDARVEIGEWFESAHDVYCANGICTEPR